MNYAANTDAARQTLELVQAAGGECRIEDDLDPVDLLVTNAGIARSGDSTDRPPRSGTGS